jgi:hypothetical protein
MLFLPSPLAETAAEFPNRPEFVNSWDKILFQRTTEINRFLIKRLWGYFTLYGGPWKVPGPSAAYSYFMSGKPIGQNTVSE